MAVKVARGVLSRIRESPDMIAIQVRGASDPEAAMRALERACGDICALDAGWDSAWGLSPGDANNPKWVSGAMLTGPGPMVLVDGGEVPYRFLRRIPELVARRLEEEGVTDAVVGVPDEDAAFAGGPIARAASLRLFPPPPPKLPAYADVPPGWLDHAMAWLLEELGDDDEVWGVVIGASFPLRASEAAAYFARSHAARTSTQLWAGEPGGGIRMVNGAFSFSHQSLVLAGGGPAIADADVVAERLKDIARALAPEVAQAFLDFGPDFRAAVGENAGYTRGEPTRVEPLCDEQAFDAFAWQVLGPGHLARMGSPIRGARPLAGGRVELALGDPDDWVAEHLVPPYPVMPAAGGAREQGRRLLAPLLLTTLEAMELERKRYRLGEYRDHDEPAPG